MRTHALPPTESDRRAFVARVRGQNKSEFGPSARSAVEQMLAAGHSHPWTYVYELTQNAIDAGARRVAWRRISKDTVSFQHDGPQALDEKHVRALASLGQSTKGLSTVGFMGVGFKSVFTRFRRARVSGFGWRFRFHVSTEQGDLGAQLTHWFETLLPVWDEKSPLLEPEAGYTTAFQLSHPADPERPLIEDLDRLAADEDSVPLAVLALRGLKEVRIDDATWRLSTRDGLVEVVSSPEGRHVQWQSFGSRYRPGDDAMRAFLEARRELREQRDGHGHRPERLVVALLPLDSQGRPVPPEHGRAYATLPTQTQVPFGFHLQADWLVDLDRRNLRPVEENAWQQAIVRQVPPLVRQILLWLKEQPEEAKVQGYRFLADPTRDDGPLSGALTGLRDDFIRTIGDRRVVPIHGARKDGYCSLTEAIRLPGRLREDFGRRTDWRADLLFGRELMQDRILGKRGADFLVWLGFAQDAAQADVCWPRTIPRWWKALEALPEDDRTQALFALWHGLVHQGWSDVPAVPTEAGTWLTADCTRFLNEVPPSANEPSGTEVAKALQDLLPKPDERLSPRLRNQVSRSSHQGAIWLKVAQHEVKLSAVVQKACDEIDDTHPLFLVELLEWALHRGDRRQDLVPLVMTEEGARSPGDALLADPLSDHGHCRRELFRNRAALVEEYAIIKDRQAVVLFLERLGVRGQVELQKQAVHYRADQRSQVEELIGAEAPDTAVRYGYTVSDYGFPFSIAEVPGESLQTWLSSRPSSFSSRGRKSATGSYYGIHQSKTGTTPCSWVRALQGHPWLLCTDGERREPSEVLLSHDPDYDDAPLADIDQELAAVLQKEGVEFGKEIPKSPALRRLLTRKGEELPDDQLAALLREAQEEHRAGGATQAQFEAALGGVKLRGAPLVSRVVLRSGPGEAQRSDLGGWVVPLSAVSSELADVIRELVPSIPETTTGRQALDFLMRIWEEQPAQVDRIRGRIAAAYRYVLDDVDEGSLPRTEWEKSRSGARLFGQGEWRPVGTSSLIVDDVQSPFILQSLPADRLAAASSHLGETPQSVRRVAERLGVPLLSKHVRVEPGRTVGHEPPWTHRLKTLLMTLALLEDRRHIRALAFHEGLTLHVAGNIPRTLLAYADGEVLRLAGDPSRFAPEAAGQLVNHFQLRQRGNTVPWLTGALYALEHPKSFQENLRTLAAGLGVEACIGNLEPDDLSETEAKEHRGEASVREPETVSKRRAKNQVAVFVDTSGRDGSDTTRSTPAQGKAEPRSDEKARKAVVAFEAQQGREAREAPASQPGFDVVSLDPETGEELRRIEVKSVQGRFEGPNASVLLSPRQVNDALTQEDGAEYWLYVVDSTDTVEPRVIPIPWTRWRGRLQYGFFARAWNQYAEQPGERSMQD